MILKRIKTSDKEYLFAENLLQTAFPEGEYRELEKQRGNTDNNPLFHNHVIYDKEVPIGIITYWKFEDFCYIEHFAVSPDQRNGGYGKKVLEHLSEIIRQPIVLEVELPTTEMSKRRIGFYERLGYKLIQESYYQPPYRKQDEKLPMYLMINDPHHKLKDTDLIKKTIYKYVYNTDDEAFAKI